MNMLVQNNLRHHFRWASQEVESHQATLRRGLFRLIFTQNNPYCLPHYILGPDAEAPYAVWQHKGFSPCTALVIMAMESEGGVTRPVLHMPKGWHQTRNQDLQTRYGRILVL